jgi:hypothetical protein
MKRLGYLALTLSLLLLAAAPAQAAQKAQKPAAQGTAQAGPDPNAQSLADFFKGEAAAAPRTLDFSIEAGYADIRAESADTSGRYFLAGHALTSVAPDIYRLDLTFKKKLQRDIIDLAPEYYFTKQITYYFWYNGGSKIVFKAGGAKREFPIPKKELTEIKVKSLETYTIEKTKLTMDLKILEAATQVYLQIKFR